MLLDAPTTINYPLWTFPSMENHAENLEISLGKVEPIWCNVVQFGVIFFEGLPTFGLIKYYSDKLHRHQNNNCDGFSNSKYPFSRRHRGAKIAIFQEKWNQFYVMWYNLMSYFLKAFPLLDRWNTSQIVCIDIKSISVTGFQILNTCLAADIVSPFEAIFQEKWNQFYVMWYNLVSYFLRAFPLLDW